MPRFSLWDEISNCQEGRKVKGNDYGLGMQFLGTRKECVLAMGKLNFYRNLKDEY